MLDRRFFLGLAAGSVVAIAHLGFASRPASAQKAKVYTGIVKGVAVGGYDPVAYFTEKRAVKGNPAVAFDYDGAKWFFASEANREAFKAAPEKYAPQYGGYCAWAVSQGYTAKGDPDAWTVHDGKLYLNYNASVRRDWSKNIPDNVAKGDANWPKVIAK
ncbi:MAG: YHS domain-containing (seleno)protein [Hyphomicrobiaceae bacterium]